MVRALPALSAGDLQRQRPAPESPPSRCSNEQPHAAPAGCARAWIQQRALRKYMALALCWKEMPTHSTCAAGRRGRAGGEAGGSRRLSAQRQPVMRSQRRQQPTAASSPHPPRTRSASFRSSSIRSITSSGVMHSAAGRATGAARRGQGHEAGKRGAGEHAAAPAPGTHHAPAQHPPSLPQLPPPCCCCSAHPRRRRTSSL